MSWESIIDGLQGAADTYSKVVTPTPLTKVWDKTTVAIDIIQDPSGTWVGKVSAASGLIAASVVGTSLEAVTLSAAAVAFEINPIGAAIIYYEGSIATLNIMDGVQTIAEKEMLEALKAKFPDQFSEKDQKRLDDLKNGFSPHDPNVELADLDETFGNATPIVLDLDGNGIRYTAISQSKAYFDLDNDGFAKHVEWISKKDGFLVRDLNKNGRIDNQTELFSDNGGTSAYQKLAALDSNGDKKIDAKDKAFASLKIWRDLDGDGKTDKGELMSLSKAGIKSLSLQKTNATDLDGHAVNGTSVFTWENGKKGIAADAILQTNEMDAWYNRGDIEVDPNTLFMPLSRGYGSLKSLHFAMSEDATLKQLVSDLAVLNTKTHFHLVYDKVQAILFQWAGVSGVTPGEFGDGAKSALLQKLTQTAGTNNVDEPFGIFAGVMMERLLSQGPLAHIFTKAYYDFAKDAMVLRQPLADILAKAKAGEPTEPKGHDIYWNEIARIVLAHPEEFSLNAAQLKAQIDAKAGFKTVVANIQGTTGADHIFTNRLDHTITGAAGNDYLEALSGNDTLFVSKGDGHDTIIGGNGDDTLVFGSGISWSSLAFKQTDAGLVVTIPGGGSVIMPGMSVDSFVFADGTVKSLPQVFQATLKQAATAGNDTLNGYWSNDTITGGKGNDQMDGFGGDDVFVVNQGDGQDTIFGSSGEDTLRFGSGISWASLSIKNIGGVGLVISLPGGETITMPNADVDAFVFSDGTVKTLVDVIKVAMEQTPTAGDDELYGLWTDDVIKGGAGNDWIGGYGGNDSLVGGSGNDRFYGDWEDDTLNGGAGADTLSGGWGADRFVFRAISESSGSAADLITDFAKDEDVIDLRGLGFSSVAVGAGAGTKLGYSYDEGTNITTLVSANGLKIQMAGQVDLTASDFLFAQCILACFCCDRVRHTAVFRVHVLLSFQPLTVGREFHQLWPEHQAFRFRTLFVQLRPEQAHAAWVCLSHQLVGYPCQRASAHNERG